MRKEALFFSTPNHHWIFTCFIPTATSVEKLRPIPVSTPAAPSLSVPLLLPVTNYTSASQQPGPSCSPFPPIPLSLSLAQSFYLLSKNSHRKRSEQEQQGNDVDGFWAAMLMSFASPTSTTVVSDSASSLPLRPLLCFGVSLPCPLLCSNVSLPRPLLHSGISLLRLLLRSACTTSHAGSSMASKPIIEQQQAWFFHAGMVSSPNAQTHHRTAWMYVQQLPSSARILHRSVYPWDVIVVKQQQR